MRKANYLFLGLALATACGAEAAVPGSDVDASAMDASRTPDARFDVDGGLVDGGEPMEARALDAMPFDACAMDVGSTPTCFWQPDAEGWLCLPGCYFLPDCASCRDDGGCYSCSQSAGISCPCPHGNDGGDSGTCVGAGSACVGH